METHHSITSCFALFVDGKETPERWRRVNELHGCFLEQLEAHSEIITQIRECTADEGCHAVLSVEEGGILEGDLSRLDLLHAWGVRLMTVGWNWENELGYPHYQRGHLKPFGYEVVQRMEELKILVDVSHLNDEGIEDILSSSTRPVIASHSNSRTICKHSRNLSDELIRKISETGGVVGLNFCPPFVIENSSHTSMISLVAHLQHIYQVG